ncbi:hypothetical protein FO519_007515 [Halicephalobus sp. NKZ332]|nr:hypothetical protein FO519_007515 [Halicephalobus sp. NKZ332]
MNSKIVAFWLLGLAVIASGQSQRNTAHVRAERHTDGVMTSGKKEFHSSFTRHERDTAGQMSQSSSKMQHDAPLIDDKGKREERQAQGTGAGGHLQGQSKIQHDAPLSDTKGQGQSKILHDAPLDGNKGVRHERQAQGTGAGAHLQGHVRNQRDTRGQEAPKIQHDAPLADDKGKREEREAEGNQGQQKFGTQRNTRQAIEKYETRLQERSVSFENPFDDDPLPENTPSRKFSPHQKREIEEDDEDLEDGSEGVRHSRDTGSEKGFGIQGGAPKAEGEK